MVSFLTQVYIPGYFLRTYLTGAWQMSNDPLLQPYQLKHLTLRNRIIVTAHEPAYPEDGMPKARYRAYTVERAKGGVALTMTAGSAAISRDSPPVFNNLLAYKDEIVPWIREMTDAVHEQGAAIMIQLTHLGRRTRWDKGDWLPVVAPLASPGSLAPRLSKKDRRLGHREDNQGFCRRGRTHEGRRYGWR